MVRICGYIHFTIILDFFLGIFLVSPCLHDF
jgi:hypothetical protein